MISPTMTKPRFGALAIALWLAIVVSAAAIVWWAVFYVPAPSQQLLDGTLATLEEHVRNSPQDPDKRVAVAIAYAERGMHGAAIEQFQQALKLDSANQTAMIGIGRSQVAQGDVEAALPVLLEVIEMNKDNPLLKTSEQLEAVFYEVGSIYMEMRDYENAEAHLRSALGINAVDADAWLLLGKVQFDSGNLQEALVSLLQSVRLVPNYVEAYEVMRDIFGQMQSQAGISYAEGMIRVSNRQYDEAVPRLEIAVQGLADFSSAFEGLGLAYEGIGNKKGATAAYERALALDPTLILARQGLLRMQGAE